jgi:hypothetical protein
MELKLELEKRKNKFYAVRCSEDYSTCNIVIAENSKSAKNIGHGYDATEGCRWIDLRVEAIGTGFSCFNEDTGKVEFEVIDGLWTSNKKKFVLTSLKPQADHTWELLKKELKNQLRIHIPKERSCSHCGKEMSEGYCINGGEEYYCSDDCLHTKMTQEEYLELYDEGNGDSYWTTWED